MPFDTLAVPSELPVQNRILVKTWSLCMIYSWDLLTLTWTNRLTGFTLLHLYSFFNLLSFGFLQSWLVGGSDQFVCRKTLKMPA